ncbi:Mg-transporting ATPase [Boletus edulis BED1]|uniref:Mg-transporting ATPase n=1 Tax=Boletus edulis BED1 TaxID=1328754 RepID=A0AAD4BY98_BOLED|nr:Mg-transporting ATPase [Boletus edulis BED1]
MMRFSFDAILASLPARFRVGSKFQKHGPDISISTQTKEAEITAKLARLARVPVPDVFELEPTWSPDGLSEETAAQILDVYGLNIPVNERPLAALSLLWIALWNPFNVLLTILAIINAATDSIPTSIVMITMVVASTSLRYWQEMKSMVQALKLVRSIVTRVRVIRRVNSVPQEIEVDLRHIVPGDVVAVASGDVFPGDCVVISAEAMAVTQASLTGEMLPIDKAVCVTAMDESEQFHLLDNRNVCLAGTSVAAGNGRVVVVCTGKDTYMAAIAEELNRKRPENAIQLGIRKVSYVLLAFMAVMAPAVFIVQGAVSKDWKGAVMFAIAIAVGITPEMLPMIVTSNLALSAVRIARQKVIVKRFDAIQNLGAVSVLCSDKTGTLTADLVRVGKSVNIKGELSDLPIKLSFINSLLQTGSRSPIDRAILDYVGEEEKGTLSDELDGWSKLGEVPFDSTRRMLSVLARSHSAGGQEALFITKGAVEEVLERCVSALMYEGLSRPIGNIKFDSSSSTTLTEAGRLEILNSAKRLNEDGLRLIAVAARKALIKGHPSISTEDEEDLVFVGFVALLDPLKPDAAEAIQKLGSLHVQVRILTGDVPAVAAKVARDLGLFNSVNLSKVAKPRSPKDEEAASDICERIDESSLIVTGPELAELAKDTELLNETIERAIIFAKLSPYQKLDVVKALRGGGRRAVAFLGDGVNDALAIRGADVGISVDSGTEIAKEAADVILLEKSLDVVARGVVEGRITLLNTVKYIKMACSSNFGNVFSVLIASAWLPYQPMLPLQLLIQNLLYDFSQASIPWDNVDPEYLERPKTWSAWSIVRFMVCIGPFSSPFDITTFSINWFHYKIRTANSPLVPLAQTNWFLEGSLTQLFIIQFLRTHKIPFIQSRASLPVVLVTFGVACISMAIPYIPKLNSALQLTPPVPMFYAYLVGTVAGYALVVHIVKTIYLRVFNGEWL